jgi:hypothetical protein
MKYHIAGWLCFVIWFALIHVNPGTSETVTLIIAGTLLLASFGCLAYTIYVVHRCEINVKLIITSLKKHWKEWKASRKSK